MPLTVLCNRSPFWFNPLIFGCPFTWGVLNSLFNTNNDLFKAVSWGSAILEGNSVYIIGGSAPSDFFENFELPVQRIDLAQDGTIEQVELIAEHTFFYENPYLLITDADTCATNWTIISG